MQATKIGDKVILVAPSGKKRTVVVTDVIRCVFSREVIAIEFNGVTLPIEYFRKA